MGEARNVGMMYTDYGKKKALGKLVKVGENEQTALAYVEKNKVIGYKLLDEIVRDSYTKDIPKCDIDLQCRIWDDIQMCNAGIRVDGGMVRSGAGIMKNKIVLERAAQNVERPEQVQKQVLITICLDILAPVFLLEQMLQIKIFKEVKKRGLFVDCDLKNNFSNPLS